MISPVDVDNSLRDNRNKSSVNMLVNKILSEGINLQQYFDYIETVEPNRKWHFTWVLTHLIEREPSIGKAHQELIWHVLRTTHLNGVKRDLWRSLTFIEINEALSAEIFDTALIAITSQKEPIAVRAHAMLVATNIAKPHKALRSELLLIFSSLVNDDSAGIRSRSKNLSRVLKKLN